MLDKLKQLFNAASAGSGNAITSITPLEAKEKLLQKGVVMIDVREPDEYRVGHVKGSKLMPLGTVAKRWQELSNAEQIVVMCHSGSRSMMACRQLASFGLANVFNLSGGMIAWSHAKLPIQK